MKLTPEQISAVRAAKTPEEVITIADKLGVTVTESDANLFFTRLHESNDLSDEELAAISGGGCGGESLPTSCVKGYDNMAFHPYKCKGCGYVRFQDFYVEFGYGRKEATHEWCHLDPSQSPIREGAHRYGPVQSY
jgi:hypothetical protein